MGFYLHQEGPNLGKTSCPLSPVTIRLDAQFGTPYPRSAGFDTDRWAAIFFVIRIPIRPDIVWPGSS